MAKANSHTKSAWDLIAKGLAVAAVTSLTACGGGGVTPSGGGGAGVAAGSYTLFASNYITTATTVGSPALGLFSIQGGQVYGGGSANFPITYSTLYVAGVGAAATQASLNYTGFYYQQGTANGSYGSTDNQFVTVNAPNNGTFDISTAATLLIQMGNPVNQYTPAPKGNANVFTVSLINANSKCSYEQTLLEVGPGTYSPQGIRSYAIPISSFTTCSKGSLADLQTIGITGVAVNIDASKNPSLASGDNEQIGVGSIGFTSTVSSGDITTLNTL